jgi:hypothetical protein
MRYLLYTYAFNNYNVISLSHPSPYPLFLHMNDYGVDLKPNGDLRGGKVLRESKK